MDIYRRVIPYCIALALTTLLIIFIPALSTWLPNLIYGVAGG
jgi:TRAP-type C4-dicarboxylate transport system permease large subunit